MEFVSAVKTCRPNDNDDKEATREGRKKIE